MAWAASSSSSLLQAVVVERESVGVGVEAGGRDHAEEAGVVEPERGVVLAEEVKDWSEAFERLRDSALRRSLAAAGRQLVKESYSVQAWAPKLARIYRNLAPRR